MSILFRFLNRNIKIIFITVLIFFILISGIKTLNNSAGGNIIKRENDVSNSANNIDFEKSLTNTYTEDNFADVKQKTDIEDLKNNVIVNFIDCCNNKNPKLAYSILSQDCKNEIFPTEQDFIDKYYNIFFATQKIYTYEPWISNNKKIYRIQFSEDTLATGKIPETKIEEFYTIVQENGETKLNINGYIGSKDLNIQKVENNIKIAVSSKKTYMNYVKYDLNIVNNTENTIMLDSLERTDTVYLINSRGIKNIAYMFELLRQEFIIGQYKARNITIKFSEAYNSKTEETTEINFSDIILDYKEYEKYDIKSEYKNRAVIKMKL